MTKRFAFDVGKAIPEAWKVLWAANLKSRAKDAAYEKKVGKKPYGWAKNYYLTAADVENQVRVFAVMTSQDKPWSEAKIACGRPWTSIRISGNLQRAVRDWLLRGNGGKIVGHNFGRGHISGMRFRPVGEPISEAEKETIKKKEERKDKPRPQHFAKGGYGSRPACTKPRGGFSFRSSKAWTTSDRAKVTCPRCLKLLAALPVVADPNRPRGLNEELVDANE